MREMSLIFKRVSHVVYGASSCLFSAYSVLLIAINHRQYVSIVFGGQSNRSNRYVFSPSAIISGSDIYIYIHAVLSSFPFVFFATIYDPSSLFVSINYKEKRLS